MKLSHTDDSGRAQMVDISEKEAVQRSATAYGKINLQPKTIQLINDNALQKGDVLATARIAGIMAAKRVDDLIPLCHTLSIEQITLDFKLVTDGVEIIANAKMFGKTGVEMEVLTAVSVAALTIYDMCKAVDKMMHIENIQLLEKKKSKKFKIVSLNTSEKKGEIKKPTAKIILQENYGISGDAHAGAWHRQVSLLAAEDIERHKGEINYGEFAENITTRGIDLHNLSIGTLLFIGEAILEITQIGKECHSKCEVFTKVGDCIMPRRGIFAKVIKGGEVTNESNCYYDI